MTPNKRLIVAITGASGSLYGVRLLKLLQQCPGIESHLLVSDAGLLNLQHELGLSRFDVEKMADVVHDVHDIGASIASGSFRTIGMVVAPCSMKSLSGIAHGYADNLVTRAADVVLKERRRLILMVRETPFSLIHLRNMTTVTEAGGIIFPPLPAFYHRPESIEAMVDQTVARLLGMFDIPHPSATAWSGSLS